MKSDFNESDYYLLAHKKYTLVNNRKYDGQFQLIRIVMKK